MTKNNHKNIGHFCDQYVKLGINISFNINIFNEYLNFITITVNDAIQNELICTILTKKKQIDRCWLARVFVVVFLYLNLTSMTEKCDLILKQ